ncbi:MAG: hypothetical protein FIA92_10690 [Chloroflexi bacterium]|nr:hypothetical protein [Chloroflexota bacterium]
MGGVAAGAATQAHAVDENADEHEGHTDEDDQVRGQLRTGHAALVVSESRIQVGDQIGRDPEDHDCESELRSEGHLMRCLGHPFDNRDP